MLKKMTVEMLIDTTARDSELKRAFKELVEIKRRDEAYYQNIEAYGDDMGTLEATVVSILIEDCNKPVLPFRKDE